ncbi:hypothetical protein CTI12_AA380610 [Artemisia annua]|uniref:Uncharacterized protein n=1 Tax=Artemisia annua TaxID=35608 RepID=A0A2U1MHC0_ARTAN|nr:hypothetical protein CTI12_AA380610 [Artemisia annua]
MAIDLYSDNTMNTTTSSPRISFSYDLTQSDTVPVEQLLRSFSSSSVDFNFIVNNNHSDHANACMADELFYDGKIIPTQARPKPETRKFTPLPEKEKLRDSVQEPQPENTNNKSFWGFKRSSSCGSGYGRSLCPNITLLSRSHSTDKRGFQKGVVSQKPPLRKSGYGYGNGNNSGVGMSNGIRVNPVLNLGFGSFFSSNNKNKSKK